MNCSKPMDCASVSIKSISKQFTSKTSLEIGLNLSFTNKLVSTFNDTEFLETYLDITPSGKICFEKIAHK
jgi:hypothetical protein